MKVSSVASGMETVVGWLSWKEGYCFGKDNIGNIYGMLSC